MKRDASSSTNIRDIARAILTHPQYERSLIQRLKAGTVDRQFRGLLLRHARATRLTDAREFARRVLRGAKVSWKKVGPRR